MKPFIEIFGIAFPTYGVMVSAGFVAAISFVLAACIRRRLEVHKCIIAVCLAVMAGLFGSKLLSIITLYSPHRITELLLCDPLRLVTDSGLVFYGGIITGVPAAYLASKLLKFKISEYEEVIVPAIPLGHAFGRLGVFSRDVVTALKQKFSAWYIQAPNALRPRGKSFFRYSFSRRRLIFFFLLFSFSLFSAKTKGILPSRYIFRAILCGAFLPNFCAGMRCGENLVFFPLPNG